MKNEKIHDTPYTKSYLYFMIFHFSFSLNKI